MDSTSARESSADRRGAKAVGILVGIGRTIVILASVAGVVVGVLAALFAIGMGGFGAGRANPWVVLGLFTPVPFFGATFLTAARALRRGTHLLLGWVALLSGGYILVVALRSPPGGPRFAAVFSLFTLLWLSIYWYRLRACSASDG